MTRAKVTSKSDFAVVQNDDKKMVECENCSGHVEAWTRKKYEKEFDELKVYRRTVDGKAEYFVHHPADINAANELIEHARKELNK